MLPVAEWIGRRRDWLGRLASSKGGVNGERPAGVATGGGDGREGGQVGVNGEEGKIKGKG